MLHVKSIRFSRNLPRSNCNTLQSHRCTSKVSDNVTVSFAGKYDCQTVEESKYDKWLSAGYFHPRTPVDKTFSMILPPPNITGTLHLGHALTITIQDVLCRWKRMLGYSVSWVPGTDHAGIATQVMVEKHLFCKTGQTRHDLGREKFLQLVEQWKEKKINKINQQLKQLGASVDWSKYYFTMDSKQSEAVVEAVIRMFDDGLLYREKTSVNWSCYLLSTISDYEIEYVNLEKPTMLNVPGYDEPIEFGTIFDCAYKVIDSDEEIVVSTTRPETLFGDVAVAVHPEDQRYSHLHGAQLWNTLRQCAIPVILDNTVNPKFGTGAVKITPAHSRMDLEIGKRHNLPSIAVFTESGHLTGECGDFATLPRFAAKKKLLTKLSELGLLRDTRNHKMQLPICGRTGDVIEQMLKSQWFVKCDKLAERAIKAVEHGNLNIKPEKHKDMYIRWLDDTKDWCISRQLWWGHRLPLYETEHGWIAARSENEAKVKAEAKFNLKCTQVKRDEDVLDTWFSSALLPFSVFGWPQTEEAHTKFYPLDLLETGSDILNFWVVRMVLLGLYFTDSVPFEQVLLHGMLCDSRGRKMSKSKGNVIEFENIIDGITLKELNDGMKNHHKEGLISETELAYALKFQKELFPQGIAACGADALRLALTSLDSKDQVINFNPVICRENTKFCNKMWQASKFLIGWSTSLQVKSDDPLNPLFPWQCWLLHRLSKTVDVVTEGLEQTDFHKVTKALKNFFHRDMCDTYVEIAKPLLKDGSREEAASACLIGLYCLEVFLRLMSPIMPFVTEELYSYLPTKGSRPIWESTFPRPEEYNLWKNEIAHNEMQLVREIVTGARALIQNLQCKKGDVEVIVISERNPFLKQYCSTIRTLTRCKSVKYYDCVSTEMLGPVNTIGDEAVVQLVGHEPLPTEKLVANLKLLNLHITQSQKEVNDWLQDSKKAMQNPHEMLQNAVQEWNSLQLEIDEFFKKSLDNSTLGLVDVAKAAKFVSQTYKLETRVIKALKTR